MRLAEIITEARRTFYHGSRRQFPVGFVLRPQPDGYVHGVYGDATDTQIRATEKILEDHRPQGMISRYEAVFLCDNRAMIENAGGHAAYIHVVSPEGACERACLWWYAEIENATFDGQAPSQEEAALWSHNYWHAVPPPESKIAIYEYRCRSAVVLRPAGGRR